MNARGAAGCTAGSRESSLLSDFGIEHRKFLLGVPRAINRPLHLTTSTLEFLMWGHFCFCVKVKGPSIPIPCFPDLLGFGNCVGLCLGVNRTSG